MYNGLQNDMTSFAKFAFIFEKPVGGINLAHT